MFTLLINIVILGLVIVAAMLVVSIVWKKSKGNGLPPIKVGVMFSYSGHMSALGSSVRDAALLAINEINERGGLLGRELQPILRDGCSNYLSYQKASEELITKDKVSIVFGCWTSVSRKAVKPLFEKYDHLLIYPIQYEGLEESPNIIYTGSTPNQQMIPTIKWAFDNLGKRFFLVGSDYIFPHVANAMIKDQIKALEGEIAGEEYLLLNAYNISLDENQKVTQRAAQDINQIVNKILETKPTVIINTLNSGDNLLFFKKLRDMGITPKKIPTISFTFGENLLSYFDPELVAGDFLVANYFQNIPNEVNNQFVKTYKEKYGEKRSTDDAIESVYLGVHLWAQAVNDAGTDDVTSVRSALKRQTFAAPEGLVTIDANNQHTWKTVRIGKIRHDGQIDIIWSSKAPVQPLPYPVYRSKEEWTDFLNQLYKNWGDSWKNPDSY